jgi:hypothetical protein
MKNRNILNTMLLLALSFLALSPIAQAVVPAPDGGYPGGNTAEGQNALLSLTTGTYNTAVGLYSLLSLTDGNFCTGVGAGTLLSNSASENTAIGAGALLSNTTGLQNTANGAFALFSNTEGSFNTATGYKALFSTTGTDNTASGRAALFNNTTGNNNIALGVSAGTAVTTANNVIAIGTGGANVDNTCFIGNIRGVPVNASGVPVVIDMNNQLGTIVSSRRFKNAIKPMDKASEAILALKPVTFHYKSDATGTPQFGLIAEEVAEVNPNLVVRDKTGDIYTVRYDAVNAMLLNEFLKEHRKVQEQEASIAQMKKGMDALVAHIKEQDSKIQKVSDRVEMSKAAAQVATIK